MEHVLERLVVHKSIQLKVRFLCLSVSRITRNLHTGWRPGNASQGKKSNWTILPKTTQMSPQFQNVIQGELVNGSVGQVVSFGTTSEAEKSQIRIPNVGEKKPPPNDWAWPVVRFIGGQEMLCIPHEFTVNNADGSTEARRDQVGFH